MSEDDTFDLVCKCTKETEKALLVESRALPDGEAWVPKSVVSDDSEVFGKGHEGVLVVKSWFAKKEGWE